jgi:iron(III) transport system ATP-binding protein
MAPASLDFKNVIKRYGSVTAVDGISFRCEAGTLTTLLGPSGCGKTTTLRMIAGLELASEGQILIGGRDVTHLSAAERDVTMVFQSYALFPHMNVTDNIAFGLKMEGMPKGEIEARVQEMLKLVKLEPFATRKPHQMSGGQRQRVALARALVSTRPVLLLDEPFSALDPGLRREMIARVDALRRARGLTVLMTLHTPEDALDHADLAAFIAEGRVADVGPAREVMRRGRSAAMDAFLG